MNIYSVLDDSDEEEVTKVVAPKKEKDVPVSKKEPATKKETSSKPAKAVEATESKAKPIENKPKEQKALPTSNSFGDLEVSGKEDTRGGRGRGKGGGRGGEGRGGGRGRREATGGDEDNGKKVKHDGYDRRDGTGRGNGRSKGGRGSFGAGNVFQEALEGEKDPKAVVEESATIAAAEEEAETEVVPESEVPVEPEVPTYTLDEFLKQREETRQKAIAAGLASREAVRKVDAATEFAGLTLKEKVALDDYLPDVYSKAETVGKKDQRSTGKAVILDVGFKSAAPPQQSSFDNRENRERTGRGSGRGGGDGGRRSSGRGGGSSGRYSGPSTVFNALDFPSL